MRRDMQIEADYARVERELRRIQPRDSGASRMLTIHMSKPWVVGFRAVLIRPRREGLGEFLGPMARSWPGHPGEIRRWYVPSAEFWLAHAKTSHPPNGRGCDPKTHAQFLASDAKDPEFGYGNLLEDDQLLVEDAAGFRLECEWWAEYARSR